MRKLVLVVIALVLAALVWMFAQVLAPSITRSPAAIAPRSGTEAMTSLDPVVDGGSSATPESRSALESSPAADRAQKRAKATGSGLRVIVRFARDEDYKPNELDVRVLDLLGEEHFGERERDNAFLFPNLPPDTYTIEATEAASMKSVQRVNLGPLEETKVVEVTLASTRSLTVHWTASDGRPIAQAVRDPGLEPGERTLEVTVSHMPLRQQDSGNPSLIVDSINVSTREAGAFDKNDGLWEHSVQRPGTGEGSLDLADDRDDPGLFCTLEIRTAADLWLTAWYRGKLLDSQRIARDQSDVRFVTSPTQLSGVLVPLTLRLIDDVTGAPVTSASINVGAWIWQRHEVDSQGRCACVIEAGWTKIDVQSSVRAVPVGMPAGAFLLSNIKDLEAPVESASSKHAWLRLEVFARPGEALDLGDIRVPRARAIRFRVLDMDMRPVEGAEVELIRKASFDELAGDCDLQHASSNHQGLAVFDVAATETYVAACHFIRLGSFDSDPLVVDARKVGEEVDAIAGEIILRPVRKVVVEFNPPRRPGARAFFETPAGLLVSAQELDDFGLCVLGLGGLQYQLRIVEDGAVQRTVPFSVSSDPFVLTVNR